MIKVLIADDHAIVRAGLRALVHSESTMELVGEATGGYEAIDMIEKTHPDVLVLDLSMPDLDGISVTKQIRSLFPDLRILILTIHEDEALLRAALKTGATGYILKHAAEAELISAIHTILRGDLYVDPSMVRKLFSDEVSPQATTSQPTVALTPRETEVLKLIVRGYTNRQIGEELSISIRTAESHRSNLSEKLGLHSRVDLVRYAREHGIIE
ncbi:MAG TPA: response regulator transcription factor [Anaerolineales bacterium]|nr:response regulator transcription factor [Anaerolineales bacterium]